MATQLEVYNQALLHLKSQQLASLSEATERRRVLDTFYPKVLQWMLEQAYWKFAIRSVQIDPDGAITPAFGLQHAFNKPDDWISTYAVSANEYFDPPLQEWIEESNLWFSDVNPIYVRYVSNNATDYGADLSRWTSRFEQAFTLELAMRAAPKISGSNELKGELKDERNDELAKAKSFEALREPPRRAPEGAWVTAHHRGGPERLPGGWRF